MIINKSIEPRRLILSSGIIIGIMSMFLIESVLLGKLTLSLQPGTKMPDMLITNRVGASVSIFNIDEIEPMTEKIIFNDKFKVKILEKGKLFGVQGMATDNVINQLFLLLSENRKNYYYN